MCTNGQVVSCSAKQAIKKYVREMPCPKKKEPTCTTIVECRKPPKRVQKIPCAPEVECRRVPKCIKCAAKMLEMCPTLFEHSMSPRGCPKCDENRLQRLECEMFQLRTEMEHMRYEQKESERKLHKAILRGACALSGGLKTHVPESIEKLLNCCDSEISASSSCSVTLCTTKQPPPCEIPSPPCGIPPPPCGGPPPPCAIPPPPCGLPPPPCGSKKKKNRICCGSCYD